MPFEVRLHRKAESNLLKMRRSGEKKIVEMIVIGLEAMSDDPYHPRPGVDILQLRSVDPKLYRLRIGPYRVLYSIDKRNAVVNVTKIIHRKHAYK